MARLIRIMKRSAKWLLTRTYYAKPITGEGVALAFDKVDTGSHGRSDGTTCSITWTAKGTANGSAITALDSLTIANVALFDGDVLYVAVGTNKSSGLGYSRPTSVAWGAKNIPLIVEGLDSVSDVNLISGAYCVVIGAGEGGTHDIVVTYNVLDLVRAGGAVAGVVRSILAPTISMSGAADDSTSPVSWLVANMASSCSIVILSVATWEPPSSTPSTWLSPFVDDQRVGASGAPMPDPSNIVVHTSYRIGDTPASETVGEATGTGAEGCGCAIQVR